MEKIKEAGITMKQTGICKLDKLSWGCFSEVTSMLTGGTTIENRLKARIYSVWKTGDNEQYSLGA